MRLSRSLPFNFPFDYNLLSPLCQTIGESLAVNISAMAVRCHNGGETLYFKPVNAFRKQVFKGYAAAAFYAVAVKRACAAYRRKIYRLVAYKRLFDFFAHLALADDCRKTKVEKAGGKAVHPCRGGGPAAARCRPAADLPQPLSFYAGR